MEFKSGDKVIKIDGEPFGDGKKILEVDRVYEPNLSVWLSNGCWIHNSSIELVESVSPVHIHHDCIIAWAKGNAIEFLNSVQEWRPCSAHGPSFCVHTKYRVKPDYAEEKERLVELAKIIDNAIEEVKQLEEKIK